MENFSLVVEYASGLGADRLVGVSLWGELEHGDQKSSRPSIEPYPDSGNAISAVAAPCTSWGGPVIL